MFKQKSDSATATLSPADAVQQARVRARRRLIGAVVLLGIGIIGFPLVFETQPRPIPVDIPIEIPRKDSVPPLVAPVPPVRRADSAPPEEGAREQVITESRGDAGRDVTPAIVPASAAAPPPTVRASSAAAAKAPASTSPAPAASASEPARKVVAPAPKASASSAESERAQALLEGRAVAAADTQRFVVQVGAFADADAARATRQKIEKLGLKTYTQVAQTSAGSRIRVRIGPFATREEADAALAKAKTAGVDAVVLTL